MIYAIILCILHVLIELVLFVRETTLKLYKFINSLCGFCHFSQKRRLQLDKIPNHLSLLFVENDISIIDIANIILWSAAFGIKYLSFYDHEGNIKKRRNELESILASNFQSKAAANFVVNFENNRNVITSSDGNGDKKDETKDCNQINITLLSCEDGRQDIVNAAKYLSKIVECETIKPEHIAAKNLGFYLTGASGFPDPELLISFGKIESLLGFLPWQIRLSEILSLPTHKNIVLKSYFEVLERFGKCEKRWGK